MRGFYKQCELSKPIDGGVMRMISWIPATIAIAGKTVGLKDSETGEQTSGWRVENVTEPAIDSRIILQQSRDYLKTRDASDV